MSRCFYFIVWLVIVLMLSIVPVPPTEIGKKLSLDTIVHFLIYGITSLLFLGAASRRLQKGRYLVPLSIAFSSLYGLLLEVVQSLMPYRSFSAADILANAIGAIVFVIVYSTRPKETQ